MKRRDLILAILLVLITVAAWVVATKLDHTMSRGVAP